MIFLARDSFLETNKPYELLYDKPDMQRGCNFDEVTESVAIEDFRPLKGKLSLDRDGFVLVDLPRSMPYEDYFNEDALREGFVSDAKRILQDVCGARAVYIHECVIRKRSANEKEFGAPIPRVHGDYTMGEASKLIRQLCGDRAEAVRNHRYQMINVWKPLKGPLKDWPLAFCKLSSVEEDDLKKIDLLHREDTLESYRLHYNPKQQWGYFKEQETSEIVIFKSADSVISGTVLHCAFDNPECPPQELPRESIELRALVVH